MERPAWKRRLLPSEEQAGRGGTLPATGCWPRPLLSAACSGSTHLGAYLSSSFQRRKVSSLYSSSRAPVGQGFPTQGVWAGVDAPTACMCCPSQPRGPAQHPQQVPPPPAMTAVSQVEPRWACRPSCGTTSRMRWITAPSSGAGARTAAVEMALQAQRADWSSG